MRRGAKHGKAKVEARPSVARKSLKNQGPKVRDLEKRLAEALGQLQTRDRDLTEALEQQTATSDILRVISQSQTDVQPVFDTIVTSARALTGAQACGVFLLHGDIVSIAAHDSWTDEWRQEYPRVVSANTVTGRAMLERTTVHVTDLETNPDYEGAPGRRVGIRTVLAVPMLREGQTIGAISVWRTKVKSFSDQQIALLQTFVDQAVIAIENVRLFKELGERNTELTESLRRQTTTGEILSVISRTRTDPQPVFDAIARNAAVLCEGDGSGVFRRLEDRVARVARAITRERTVDTSAPDPWLQGSVPLGQTSVGQVIVTGTVLNVPDTEDQSDQRLRDAARANGFRSVLTVPMLRDGEAIGAISVTRRQPGPFSDSQVQLLQTFADQAVIAIENVRLFTELEGRNRDVTEALEHQIATSEILSVISSSPTDVRPVFEAIVRKAVQLCGALYGLLFRYEDELYELVAHHNLPPEEFEEIRRLAPQHREAVLFPQVLEGAVVDIADVERLPDPEPGRRTPLARARERWRARGVRSVLVVPMRREGEVVGSIGVSHREVGAFTASRVDLLKTFANQAVIAIENVRLFKETKEALEQQTATSEILRVIASSPTDLQPVLDAIAASAARLCDSIDAQVFRIDGEVLRIAASYGSLPKVTPADPRPINRGSVNGRAVVECRTIHIHDLAAESDSEWPAAKAYQKRFGHRTIVATPLLREGVPLGAITIRRMEVRPFSDTQITLLETFADQAVIAIENVRLFTELQASNRELTTALDQQTATSDILRVISQSQTDVQPVFDAIVASAVRLLRGSAGAVTRISGDQIELAALTSTDGAGDAAVRALFPQSLQSELPLPQAIRDRAPVNIADIQTDPRYPEALHAVARARGYQSLAVVPMLRHDAAAGTISVTRREPGGFTDDEMELLKTFADQAVIAVENVRLFTELEGRNRDLTVALEQQTATSELLKVIGRSTFDLQPVFDTLAENAVRLCEAERAFIFRFDGQLLRAVASYNASVELRAFVERNPIAPGRHSCTARTALERRTIHIDDVMADPEYTYGAKQVDPIRTVLTVPMLRAGELLGVILTYRHEVLPFTDSHIALLETFADQAAIAIENVRLFNELEARTQELTRSVEQLTALSEVSRAVSSTLDVEMVLDTIVSRATQLAGADGCSIYEFDDATGVFHVRATHGIDAALVGTLRAMPLRKGEGVMGRAAEMREPIQIADIAVPDAYQSHLRDVLIGAGFRALLSVPLLREEQIIGSLSLNRKAPGEFSPEVVEVLKTFATQSALAIQNARLFREIADKSAQLEAASRHKSEFLANMSHELRTPLNAIIGFSEVLVDRMFGELNEKQEEYLKDIYASGQHLLSLINDILDLSKIEAGRMELEATDFDLPSAIDDALTLVRERATRRGITLGHSVDERLGQIRGDERKVKQVLLNLLSNALKFTPEGGRIDVGARVHDGVAEVSVADTGVGIAPEDQEAVFEEFRQVGTADKKVEGTGLGLALSRKFIELHGGRIWVKSQVGHGSTFTFTLPVRRAE